jgi:hypothetical protein
MEVVEEFIFTEEAEHLASAVATMALYQLLLGRDPENSYVIEEGKTQSIAALFRSFVSSAEFSDFVLSPLERKARLRHELTSPAPSAGQRDWLASLLVMPPTQRGAIAAATSWRGFFCALLGLPSDDTADDAERQIAHQPADLPVIQPVSPRDLATSESTLMSVVLEQICEIELRLHRLKALIQEMGSGVSR